MKRERYFKALEFKDIKGIIYNSAKLYGEKVAYVIKHKVQKEVSYENSILSGNLASYATNKAIAQQNINIPPLYIKKVVTT